MPAVHHYTSVRGALGILESCRLWFTERAHLNDPSEISNGTELATEILRQDGRKADADRLAGCAKKVFQDFRFFSASFSLAGDDLYQWRNYADDGRGVVLSFKASAFSNPKLYIDQFFPNDTTALVCKMSYDLVQLRSVMYDIMRKWDGKNIEELCDHVLMISSMFKHDSWKSENEYRFLIHGRRANFLRSDYYKFREQNGEVVSYLDIPIQNWGSVDDFPIYRIRFGPAASPNLGVQLGDFLSSQNIPIAATALLHSDLPYRPLRTS